MQDFLNQEEKRKSRRFEITIPVEYKMLKGSPEVKKGSITKDLCRGGTRFITNEFLPYTARLVLDIALPIPQQSVSAVSKVAWIKKLSSDNRYEVGNQFLEMSKDDKARLSDFLDTMSASQPAT